MLFHYSPPKENNGLDDKFNTFPPRTLSSTMSFFSRIASKTSQKDEESGRERGEGDKKLLWAVKMLITVRVVCVCVRTRSHFQPYTFKCVHFITWQLYLKKLFRNGEVGTGRGPGLSLRPPHRESWECHGGGGRSRLPWAPEPQLWNHWSSRVT